MTHLIVGEYDTPKYRHVAKERPDILPMAAGWVEAVRDLWIEDAEIDFAALENAWKLRTFETSGGTAKDSEAEVASRNRLVCCMTGFDDPDVRQRIADAIQAHGGSYTGDLSRKVTHLIAHKPEGKKYAAAKMWNIHTVSLEWLQHSIQRGMILDEKCYDPILPVEERGRGAWNRREVQKVSLGKRLRETAAAAQDEGRRKLRKTASLKMISQKENLWGDILGKPQAVEPPAPPAPPTPVPEDPTQPNNRSSFPGQPSVQTSRSSMDTQGSKLLSFAAMEEVAVFSSCCFYVHGFSERRAQILHSSILSLGGIICHSLDEVASASGAQMAHRFVIVPQESRPDQRPNVPENVQLVTEFFVEKCMYKTQFFDPSTQVIGRPFPIFPISGFDKLAICTAGFTGVDLNQVDKAIRQLGARYEERFTAQSSLLICTSLNNVRKQKLDLALAWRVPVVRADWLWTCIADGAKVPIKPFLFRELRQRFDSFDDDATRPSFSFEKPKKIEQKEPVEEKPVTPEHKQPSKRRVREIDPSAFSTEPLPSKDAAPVEARPEISKEDSNMTAEFETAPTHHSGGVSFSRKPSLPLSETSQNSLNQPKSPERKRSQPQPPSEKMPAVENTNKNTAEPKIVPTEPVPQKPTTKPELQPPTKASLPPSERLALSAKLATLFETPSNADTPSLLPADPTHHPAAPRPAVRRRREILGRAISNVSATSSGSHESSAPPDPNPLLDMPTAPAEEVPREDRNLSSTQVGYDDPEAEMYKKKLMGGYKVMGAGVGRRTIGGGEGRAPLTLATSGGYDVGPARGTRTRRNGR